MAPTDISVKVQAEPFESGAQIKAFKDSHTAGAIGAIASFAGTVRDLNGTLEHLTLEHYPGMTKRALKDIAHQAASRFELSAIQIIHRYGPMAAGEEIVLVITSSAHRHDAFDACRFIMDYLKTDAPFWKQEKRKDGSTEWVAARRSDDAAKDRWQS